MDKIVELTCIRCPRGCTLHARVENGVVVKVSGNQCRRGEEYAKHEVERPVRTLTTTVRTKPTLNSQGRWTLSVKSRGELPKDQIEDAARALAGVEVSAPIKLGDVIVADILGTGVDIVATSELS